MKYFLLLIPVFLFSCKKDSNEVDQDKIYQSYEISYDANTNLTTYTAEFSLENKGGKNLKLTGGSRVLVNGESMSRSGSRYTKSFQGYLAYGTFEFTDTKGKVYTNTVNCEDYIQNDFNSSLQNNFDVYWYFSGPNLASGETVTVDINSQVADGGQASSSAYNVGATYVRITPSQMNNLHEGQATARTTRSTMLYSGNWTSAGGSMKSEYKSGISNILVY